MFQEQNALVLEILKYGKGLKMGIFEQKDAALTVRHYSQCAVSFSHIEKLCLELTLLLNSANKKGLLENDSFISLKKIGQLLWSGLLTGQVKERLRIFQNRDLILSLDEELIDIPWELLFDGREFLSLGFNLGRQVRTKQRPHNAEYRGLSARPKMLILVNPTNDLKSAYLEGLHIKRRLETQRKRLSVDFKSTQVDTLYIKKNLRDYDIVHYAGHCEYDQDNPRNSGWVLNDGKFTVQDITVMGETMPLPSIIFSNACQSAGGVSGALHPDYQKKAYNLAAAFLLSGVRHYIGTVRRIEDEVSSTFAKEFYSLLLKGRTVGECMRSSRARLIREYGEHSILWAGYLLYGTPNLVLFRPRISHRRISAKLNFTRWKRPLAAAAAGMFIFIFFLLVSMWLPSLNPGAYYLFRESRDLFRDGKNREALLTGRMLIGKEPDFLPEYPVLAGASRRMGRSGDALKYYFEYAFFSQRKKNNKSLADAYINIGWLYHQQGESEKAKDFYERALSLAHEHADRLHEAQAMRKIAVWHMDRDENDEALVLLTKSSEINRTRARSKEHAYNLACDYFDTGLVFFNKDDPGTAREFYEKSLRQFQALKLKSELSDCYYNIGEIYLFEKQYERALEYYMKGFEVDSAQDNKPNIAGGYGMIGELYMEMGNTEKAEEFFNKGVEISREIHLPLELASAYRNLGVIYKQRGRINRAREYFRFAQEIYYPVNRSEYEKIKKEFFELTPPEY
ncbi:MAG: tetratricopeptide repeat protein [Candidatus Omnitrophica bacterium]|nr:tetratricopeptide repeat protein [Candidatus Omnitrophota bacterium]